MLMGMIITISVITACRMLNYKKVISKEFDMATGASLSTVVDAFGAPQWVGDGTMFANHYPKSAAELRSNCTLELWYWDPIFPDYVSICFDEKNKFSGYFRWSSP
jgi:hypothetical protein